MQSRQTRTSRPNVSKQYPLQGHDLRHGAMHETESRTGRPYRVVDVEIFGQRVAASVGDARGTIVHGEWAGRHGGSWRF